MHYRYIFQSIEIGTLMHAASDLIEKLGVRKQLEPICPPSFQCPVFYGGYDCVQCVRINETSCKYSWVYIRSDKLSVRL
jgi:hypothetical protein